MEKWIDIPGYEGLYQISDKGKVLSKVFKKHKILKQQTNTHGYHSINLYRNKKCKSTPIHRLLAENFIPNPEKYPAVNHIDGNKKNNNLENLEWCSYSHNIRHAINTGLLRIGEKKPNSKLKEVDIIAIRNYPPNAKKSEIAKRFDVNQKTISDIINRVMWKHI